MLEAQTESSSEVIKDVLQNVRNDYSRKYLCLGYGRHRITFEISETHVAKVPLNDYGIYDNEKEAQLFEQEGYDGEIPYASCSIKYVFNVPILIMEKVERIEFSDAPRWAWYVDCCQVGRTKEGKIVAYDYAQ